MPLYLELLQMLLMGAHEPAASPCRLEDLLGPHWLDRIKEVAGKQLALLAAFCFFCFMSC